MKKIHIDYRTRRMTFAEVDKIHSDMLGLVGGDKADVVIEDIAFNDTCVVCLSMAKEFTDGRCEDEICGLASSVIEEADANLHKFILGFERARIIN